MTTEGGGMKPSRDEIAAAIRAADISGPGSTVDHEEAAENVLALLSQAGGSEAMKTRCKEAVALWRGEVERLQACIKAEVDKHFKVQDKHGQENAGPPYCAADDLIWPCPIRERMGEVLFASYQVRWMSGLFPEEETP